MRCRTAVTDAVLPHHASAELSSRCQGGCGPTWGPAEEQAAAFVLMWQMLPQAVSPPSTTDKQTSLDPSLLHPFGEEN